MKHLSPIHHRIIILALTCLFSPVSLLFACNEPVIKRSMAIQIPKSNAGIRGQFDSPEAQAELAARITQAIYSPYPKTVSRLWAEVLCLADKIDEKKNRNMQNFVEIGDRENECTAYSLQKYSFASKEKNKLLTFAMFDHNSRLILLQTIVDILDGDDNQTD